MNTIFSFILVLGLLIFVHELGHFLFAKLFKVRVLKFSLGFGPRLFGRVVGETEYVVSALPLGGYVKMFGENPDEQNVSEEDKKGSFAHKAVWQRFFIVLAGPLFNMIFPVILFFLVFSTVGQPYHNDTTQVGVVTEDFPAYKAGVKPGDIFLEIDGKATNSWMDVLNSVKFSDGKELQIILQRGEDQILLKITPVFDVVKDEVGDVVEEKFLIGILPGGEIAYKPVSFVEAFSDACTLTWGYVDSIGTVLAKLIQRDIPASELGGPILIAQIAGQQMKAGWINLIYFISLLSVNLGLLNLLPIPVLDGGHLVFLTIEALRRKPMTEKVQIVAQQIGIAFLGTLMIFVFYNDILRLFK